MSTVNIKQFILKFNFECILLICSLLLVDEFEQVDKTR